MVLASVALIAVLCGHSLLYPTASDSEFELIFTFGVKGSRYLPVNRLDTMRDTYTQDMVVDSPVIVKMRLPEEDMEAILSKMKEIGFFQYPTAFSVRPDPGGAIVVVTPFSSYHFRVYSHGIIVKELRWDNEIMNQDPKADSLRELISFIIEKIQSDPAYGGLPEPRAGYC
jgi:hypothetical protein